jgi:hypothetical protein
MRHQNSIFSRGPTIVSAPFITPTLQAASQQQITGNCEDINRARRFAGAAPKSMSAMQAIA